MAITKNISNTFSLFSKSSSTMFGVLTNPIFWVVMVILFFPLIIFNYIVLFMANIVILIANIIIFLLQLIFFGIFWAIVSVINGFISMVSGWTITIPIINVDIHPFSGIPSLPFPTFPGFGVIPYLTIAQATIFPNKVLFVWIWETLGNTLPL